MKEHDAIVAWPKASLRQKALSPKSFLSMGSWNSQVISIRTRSMFDTLI